MKSLEANMKMLTLLNSEREHQSKEMWKPKIRMLTSTLGSGKC